MSPIFFLVKIMVFSIFFVDHLFNSVFEPNLFKQKIIRSKKIKFIHIRKKAVCLYG